MRTSASDWNSIFSRLSQAIKNQTNSPTRLKSRFDPDADECLLDKIYANIEYFCEQLEPKDCGAEPQQVVLLYNTICTDLAVCTKLTDGRIRAIRARKEPAEWWDALFKKVAVSAFLCGKNDQKWRPDFDWLLNQNNIVKVIEGRYDDRHGTKVVKTYSGEREKVSAPGDVL